MLTISAGSKSHLEGPITKVLPKITVRWDGVNWTNETSYLKSLNITKSLEDKNFGPVANTFNAIVDNTTGRFSWPAESTRTPKKWVRLYAEINGTDVLVLTGVIDTIEQRKDGTALLKGRDVSAIAIDTPAPLKTYINQSPEDIIDDLWATATGFSTSSDSTGIIMDFMKFTRATSVWDAISSVCKKTAGRVNVLPDGTLKYESLIGKNYTPKATADWTCNTDDFDSITEQLSTKDIINAVIVSYKNKQVDESKAAYMLLSDPEGNSVQQDEDERLIDWKIGEILAERHRAPEDGVIYLKRGHISSITSVMNDTTETNITAYCSVTDATSGKVTLSSGFTEGDEIRFRYEVSEMKLAINYGYTPAEGWTFEGEVANPTLDYEFGTGTATITLDDDPDPLLYPDADAVISISSISSGATLTKLWITGDVAVARIEKFKKFDNTSITVFGRQELQLELEGVSIDDARRVAQRIVDRYKDPSSTTDLSISVHPELDVMDVIEIVDNIHTNINMDYEIESVTISLSNEDAKCSVRLRQYDSVAWTYTDNGITVVAPWNVKKPLATPVFTNVAVTQNSITVSWERQFAAINHMLVLKEGASTLQTMYTTGNSYTFGSLDADTEYTIELTVIGKDGTSFTDSTTATTLSKVAIGDGSAPATPTGLDVTSFYKNGKAYIKADWDDNSESDIMGYELRWSYDESTWYNAGFTSQSELVVEVTDRSNTTTSYTVYAQVKALDVESLASDWSASDSVTVQVDTTAPNPINLITASGGVGLIRVWWTESSDPDFSYYRLERNIEYSPGLWSGWSTVAYTSSNEYLDEDVDYHIQNSPEDSEYPNVWRRYKYRARAVDKAGNVSAVSVAALGETAATYALQATGGDIAVESIIANHINAVLDLSVGRQITVGSGVAIGKDVGEVGSEFDGIYVSDGTNYVKLSASAIEMKADLVLGAGDNAIHFEDSLIDLIDGGHADTEHWVAFEYAPTGEWFASFLYANEPTSCKADLSLRSNYYNGETIEGRAYFELRTYARADPNKDYIWLRWFAGMTSSSWYYYDDGSFDIYGSISFKDYIKFGIPTWYGTKTTATNKYPNWSDWTDPEDCPHSNMWIWLKTAGTPAYVLYFKTPHDSGSHSYWVALNRVAP